MGKPVNVLKQRWGAINPAKAGADGGVKSGGGGDGGDGKKNGGDKKNGNEQKDGGEKKAEEEPKKQSKAEKKAAKKEAAAEQQKAEENPEGKPPSKSGGKPASKAGSEARFTMNEWVTLQEDDLFSFGELQLLSELIAKYDTDRWQLIASRFFDKTGRRVHPDDVRDKFLGALG